MRSVVFSLLFIVAIVIISACADKTNPTTPDPFDSEYLTDLASSAYRSPNRPLLGYWQISISADRNHAEVIPLRGPTLHLNTVNLLENKACSDCLRISNLQLLPDNMLNIDLTLEHPYPTLIKYTAFDVRGILITGSDYVFTESGRSISWTGEHIRMLNPDGFTALYNPTEYPDVPSVLPALRYTPGHLATGGDLSATLNPYTGFYSEETRRMFEAGAVETRTLTLQLVPGSLEFGYAVDACWAPVDGEITDPLIDFPPEANCNEAYEINADIPYDMCPWDYCSGPITVEIFDHQGLSTISSVTVEVPDLFSGEIEMPYSTVTAEGGFLYEYELSNINAVGSGSYPALVRVADTEVDPNLGQIDSWQVQSLRVPRGWAHAWGVPEGSSIHSWSRGNDLETDSDGNIYVSGIFEGEIDLDPGPGLDVWISNGETDTYLIKFNPEGYYDWGIAFGGNGSDGITAIAFDESNQIYISGHFSDTVDFDPGDGVDEHTSQGIWDAFLCKFTPDGQFLWAKTWGGPGRDTGGIRMVRGSSLLISGSFKQTVDFDPGNGIEERTSNGGSDAYISVFNTEDGLFQLVRVWGGAKEDYANDMHFLDNGLMLVTGGFSDSADLDPGPETFLVSSNGASDAYLSIFSETGEFEYALTWGGLKHDGAVSIISFDTGNILISGLFGGTVDFDPGPNEYELTSFSYHGGFVTSFDGGFQHEWAITWDDEFKYISSDTDLSFYACGGFGGTVDFDPGPGIDEHTAIVGTVDAYVSKFNFDGTHIWTRTWGGNWHDWARFVTVFKGEKVYTSGYFGRTADFDPGPGIYNLSIANHSRNSFLSMMPTDGNW